MTLGWVSFRPRRLLRCAIATAVAASFVFPLPAAGAVPVGSPVAAGSVVVVDVDGRALAQGHSATEFSLQLPTGAACPGDSATDQWRVQSFIIPVDEDPGTIRYGVVGPESKGQFALYDVRTRPFVNVLTQSNAGAGQPGLISALPVLSFAVFPPGTLAPGVYRVGLACTYFRQTARYWDTEMVLTSSPNDKPGQLLWRLPNVAQSSTTSSSGGVDWMIPGLVVALIALTLMLIIWSVRTRRTPTLSKEPQ